MQSSILLAALLGVAPTLAADAQARPSIAEGIEVRVIDAPQRAVIDGMSVLAWELHVLNARADTVRVLRVAVTDAGGKEVTILDEAPLARFMQPVTRGPSPTPAVVVPPGVHRVIHAWVPLDRAAPVPSRLVHAVTIAGSTSQFVIRGGGVTVATAAPVYISPPLRGGPWVALYDPALPGGHRTAIYTVDGRARIPARFAMDFVKLPASGTFDRASTAADRNGFGADVLAVGNGTVVAAVDDMPDNEHVPTVPRPRLPIEAGSGNYVVIDLGRGRYAFYEHLKSHSISVRTGQRVRAGQVIGQLGYSGSSSIGPHLHFHIADANALLGAEGRPFSFTAFRVIGAFPDIGAFVAGQRYDEPREGTPLARRREMPRSNAVVMFP